MPQFPFGCEEDERGDQDQWNDDRGGDQQLLVLLAALLSAGAPDAAERNPLFRDHAPLKAVLSAPISQAYAQRLSDVSLYFPGQWAYIDDNGAKHRLQVSIRLRGNFRRDYCELPPLRLNFKKSEVKGTLFAGQDKLKLVAHCRDRSDRYEQNLIKEYLAYRILNMLTDISYRVRLARVTYIDSEKKQQDRVQYAFFIEHKDRLAARIGRTEQEIESAEITAIEPDHLNLLSMFQYLIGNVDFSPIAGSNGECCHNYAMFGTNADALVPVPYDFDFSGIVNAPNAELDTERGVERMGQRVYRGYCENNDAVEGSVATFEQLREALYAVVGELEELEPGIRRNITSYMDEFYEVIGDPRQVEQQITGKCI